MSRTYTSYINRETGRNGLTWAALVGAALILRKTDAKDESHDAREIAEYLHDALRVRQSDLPDGMTGAVAGTLASLCDRNYAKRLGRGRYKITPVGIMHLGRELDSSWDIDTKLLGRDSPKTYKRSVGNVVQIAQHKRRSA